MLTDIDLFERRVRTAQGMPSRDAVEVLQGAIDLVTGPVFAVRRAESTSFIWVEVGDWTSHWELRFREAAESLCQLYADLGHVTQAGRVAQHVLRIIPTDTHFTEVLMHSHAAAGDPHKVDRVWHAHLEALARLEIDQPEASTRELYTQLRKTPSSANEASGGLE